MVDLVRCLVCFAKLLPHPLYEKSGAMFCPDDGDFFIQRLRGEEPRVVFRPFREEIPEPITPKPPVLKVVVPEIKIPKIVVKVPDLPKVIAVVKPAVSKGPPIDPSTVRRQMRSGRPGLRLRCDQTGIIFSSIKEAAAAMFLGRGNLSEYVNGKIKHVKGYTFTILDDGWGPPPRFVKKPRLRYRESIRGVRIRCEQTGQVFESARAASRALHLNWNNVWRHVNNPTKWPTVNGYSFEILDKKV